MGDRTPVCRVVIVTAHRWPPPRRESSAFNRAFASVLVILIAPAYGHLTSRTGPNSQHSGRDQPVAHRVHVTARDVRVGCADMYSAASSSALNSTCAVARGLRRTTPSSTARASMPSMTAGPGRYYLMPTSRQRSQPSTDGASINTICAGRPAPNSGPGRAGREPHRRHRAHWLLGRDRGDDVERPTAPRPVVEGGEQVRLVLKLAVERALCRSRRPDDGLCRHLGKTLGGEQLVPRPVTAHGSPRCVWTARWVGLLT